MLGQYGTSGGGSYNPAYLIIGLAFTFVYLFAAWRMYEKAGQSGWKAIIPIYNIYILLKIVGRPGWWLLLMLIPLVNVVVWIIVAYDLALSFGKGVGYTIGLIFLSFIFYLILGFGSARYLGPRGVGTQPAPPAPV